jgi:hypothetical protein
MVGTPFPAAGVRTDRASTFRRSSRTAGVTALEIVFAIAVMLTGLLAYSRSLVGSMALGDQTRETALAAESCRRVLEDLNAMNFSEIYARYNETPDDDPVTLIVGLLGGGGLLSGLTGGTETESESTTPPYVFAVGGLEPAPGAVGGNHGAISFPSVPDGFGGYALREDVDMPELGMPRDLNHDGVIDGLDHSGDYRILPVMARVSWTSGRRTRQLEVKTILCSK